MDGIGENIKKILLAGIGAVATTTEKSKAVSYTHLTLPTIRLV